MLEMIGSQKKKREAELEISESEPGFTQTPNLIQPFDEPLIKQNNGSQFIEQAWTESNGSEKGKFYLRTQHLFTRILLYVFSLQSSPTDVKSATCFDL